MICVLALLPYLKTYYRRQLNLPTLHETPLVELLFMTMTTDDADSNHLHSRPECPGSTSAVSLGPHLTSASGVRFVLITIFTITSKQVGLES